MWIFDSYYKGCVELWSREGRLNRTSVAYPPSFYMHLKDPHAHWDMIEGLKSRYRVEDCCFSTIFGKLEGHKIYASRKVAEKIEKQTRYAADFYESITSAGLLLIFELTGSTSHSPRPFPALIFSKPAMLLWTSISSPPSLSAPGPSTPW